MNSIKSLVAALALAGFGTAASASGALVLNPADSTAQVGDVIVVEVRGENFTDQVVGGGFDLSFDPTVLSLSSVSVDMVEWEFLTNPGTIDNSAGTLTAVWFNAFLAPLPTGNFPVATLRFNALAAGASALNLAANPLFPFVNDGVGLIDVSIGSGGVTVSVVPELSTWASLALGLACLPGMRRRFQASGQAPASAA